MRVSHSAKGPVLCRIPALGLRSTALPSLRHTQTSYPTVARGTVAQHKPRAIPALHMLITEVMFVWNYDKTEEKHILRISIFR